MIYKILRPQSAFIIMIIVILYLPLGMAQSFRPEETAIATVNSVPITVRDFNLDVALLKAEMQLSRQFLSEERIQAMQDQIVENLIDREVLHQQATVKNIPVRAQWLEEALTELRQRMGGADALRTYLTANAMTQDELKERLRKGLAIRGLLRSEAIRGIRVSDSEMQAFFRRHPDFFETGEQIRARHILIAVTPSADDTQRAVALQRIRKLQNDINAGTPLAVLALEHSECPSKSRAGDLGYMTRDQMTTEFAEIVYDLHPGQMSDIVTTRFGYHLIQVLERTPSAQITYNNARPKIERTLRRNKEHSAVQAYVTRLKKQSKIVRLREYSSSN